MCPAPYTIEDEEFRTAYEESIPFYENTRHKGLIFILFGANFALKKIEIKI